jgi:hypothetical protein
MEGGKSILLILMTLLYIQSLFFLPYLHGDSSELSPQILPVIYYHQESPFFSGAACIQMALSYLTFPDPPPSQDQITKWSDAPPEEDIPTHQMDKPFKALGFTSVYEKRLLKQITQLREFNLEGYLVIILIQNYLDETKTSEKQYLLITGFDDKGIYAHNPSNEEYVHSGESGPNIYIPNDVLIQLWEKRFWSLVIPYISTTESSYKVTIDVKGLPPETYTTIYVDGKVEDRISGETSIIYKFIIGTKHQVSVDSYVNGSWTLTKRIEYICTNNTWNFYSWNKSLEHLFIYDSVIYYYLEISSEYGNPQGSGWYLEDTLVNISMNLPRKMKVEEGVRNLIFYYEIYRVFDKWKGDITADTREYSIQMDAPKSIKAVWRAEKIENIDYKIPLIITNIFLIISIFSYAIKNSLTQEVEKKKKSR